MRSLSNRAQLARAALTVISRMLFVESLGVKIEGNWSVVPWLVHHASNLISWFRKDSYGRTSYEKIHGKKFIRKLANVEESVFALIPESRGADKLDSRWISGIFLGVVESTMEYLIGTRHGIIKVRTFRRKHETKDR